MRTRWEALYQSFDLLVRGADARRFAHAVAEPALRSFSDLGDLLGYLLERAGDLDARDRVLAALLRLARSEPLRDLAGALLWLALWPGLCRVHRRARRMGASECEALSAIGFAFTALIESLDLARVNRIAATLVRNVERAVVAALRPPTGHEPHDDDTLAAPHRDPTEGLACTRRTLATLVDHDADLVLHVVVFEESHGEAAARLGITPAAARKRLQRALERARVRLAEGVAA